jgi:hypothetical protein
MAVELNERTMKRVDQPIIWSPDYAYQYPAVAPNDAGELGAIALHGGGSDYETCTTLVRDPASSNGWHAYSADAADADPAHPMAGDYLGVDSAGPHAHEWVAVCPTPLASSNEVRVGYFAFRGAR